MDEYNKLKEQIDTILSSADVELTSQKGISKDPAVIKEQQEALKVSIFAVMLILIITVILIPRSCGFGHAALGSK